MRVLALIAALVFVIPCRAETLRQLLTSAQIPLNSFGNAELNAQVNGVSGSDQQIVLAVYMLVTENSLVGNPQLARYDHATGSIQRSEVKPENTATCCGSPEGINWVGGFALVSFHINPSAETILVIASDLKLSTTLYGFDVHEVLPGKVVFIENMIHFAPAHPERLELADLRTGNKTELYPPKNDELRADYAREHAKHLPSDGTCQKANDPCEPDLYDEDITFIGADGHGNFAFAVQRNAQHFDGNDTSNYVTPSAYALYRYFWNGKFWLYCEESLAAEQHNSDLSDRSFRAELRSRPGCIPNLSVTPDLSNADFSPFDKHFAR